MRTADAEIALRALGRAVAACGGSPEPVPLGKLESLAAMLQTAQEGRWTLAGAMITATAAMIAIEREPGRRAPPVLHLSAGERALWDGRFGVRLTAAAPLIEVRACGDDLARELLTQHPRPGRVPLGVAAFVPSFWSSGRLLAVPSLDVWTAPHCRDQLDAWFIGEEMVKGSPMGEETA